MRFPQMANDIPDVYFGFGWGGLGGSGRFLRHDGHRLLAIRKPHCGASAEVRRAPVYHVSPIVSSRERPLSRLIAAHLLDVSGKSRPSREFPSYDGGKKCLFKMSSKAGHLLMYTNVRQKTGGDSADNSASSEIESGELLC